MWRGARIGGTGDGQQPGVRQGDGIALCWVGWLDEILGGQERTVRAGAKRGGNGRYLPV